VEVKFTVRKSDFDKFAERLGLNPEELLSHLRAEVVKVGPGFRYVIDMEHFFFYVMAKLHSQQKPSGGAQVDGRSFEEAFNRAVDALAGASGYAKLAEVREAVCRELGISEEEFSRRLAELVQAKRGAYILLEGGDVKVQVGPKKYGYVKRVERKVIEVVYY